MPAAIPSISTCGPPSGRRRKALTQRRRRSRPRTRRAGRPLRVVLLRGVDRRGFVFYTNYGSRKARELTGNPHAALCQHWPALEEQIRVEGRVELVDPASRIAISPGGRATARLAPGRRIRASRGFARPSSTTRLREIEARFAGRAVDPPAVLGRLPCRPRADRVLVRPSRPPARAPALHANSQRLDHRPGCFPWPSRP